MLGVIIGIVSVVMVVGIGEGIKKEVAKQISQFGDDLITIRPGDLSQNNGTLVSSTDLLFGLNSLSGLTEKDLQVVEKSDHIRLAAPLSVVSGQVKHDNQTLPNSLVLATDADLPNALNQSLRYGDFFPSDDSEGRFAVIGQNVAQSLFGVPVPLGRSFIFRGEMFIVRGIFAEFKSTPLSPISNFNNAIFIPYSVAQKLSGERLQMYSILAKPDRPDMTEAAITGVKRELLKQHGGQNDFSVLDQAQAVAASRDVLNLVTTLIAAVAAISLIVGGVGIMNIMLASVTERMHEIGVRKAIGATNRQILNQFVLEAAVLSLFGGVIGVLVSLVGVYGLRLYTDLQPVVSWQAIGIATLTSLAIGIVFGAAPAIKAARKDPIEALRHE
jgi:ABC-type antimicrobial peptide transport system permease subunit